MEKIVTVYQELKTEVEKKQKELTASQKHLENFKKHTVSLLKNDGWLTWNELVEVYDDKRNIKVWVEEVDDLGLYLRLKLICVDGDENFKGSVIRYTTLKTNKNLLASRYEPSEIFNIYLLKLQNDLNGKFEEKKFGDVVLYKKPKEFYSQKLYTEKPGRK